MVADWEVVSWFGARCHSCGWTGPLREEDFTAALEDGAPHDCRDVLEWNHRPAPPGPPTGRTGHTMELSTAARKLWDHRDVETALVESGDYSPRGARVIVQEAIATLPTLATVRSAAAHWVRFAPYLCTALGVTEEEAEAIEDASRSDLFRALEVTA